jgi:succinate dehydrogenase / fumarate reductase membrane anchor subunit
MSTDTRNVRGLGASGTGTTHYIHQRVTAIGLVFLVPWFIYSIINVCRPAEGAASTYEAALLFIGEPINAILMILTLGAALFHMRLGLQVVIEDYISKSGSRQALLILNTFAVIALFTAALVSIVKIWMTGGA